MTISVLIADDEPPALDELEFLLGADSRVGTVYRAPSGADAVRIISQHPVDVVFLDIHMPGLSGFDLARALGEEDAVPVTDGVACAVALMEGLVRVGLTTSKAGAYAPPRAKPYTGLLGDFAPRG